MENVLKTKTELFVLWFLMIFLPLSTNWFEKPGLLDSLGSPEDYPSAVNFKLTIGGGGNQGEQAFKPMVS